MQECPVRVAVRVRPLLAQERLHHHELCVKVNSKANQIVVGKDRAFTFDHVMSSKTSQEAIYQTCVDNLITSFFEGYNATVFAYGQTGSGKTFTIGGADVINIPENEQGIIPRAIGHIFENIQNNHNRDFTIHVSYIEVYKEDLRDLLDMETSSKDMHIREDDQGNTVILGTSEIPCSCMDDVLRCLEIGSTHRHTGATNMNEHSSRSHSIFTILMDQRWKASANSPSSSPVISPRGEDELSDEDDGQDYHFMSAKFHFVDLAGSERAHRTGNAGERFKESVYINSGLLSLGNVISALSDPKRKATHIPYRDSKITRLLKDSLGGNAKTCMITCISPSAVNFDETLNSLKYANRARNIKNKPIVNKDKQATRIAEMQTEIQALRDELQRHRLTTANTEVGPDTLRVQDLEEQITRLRNELSHFRVCTDEASKIFAAFQDSDRLTKAQRTAVNNWMDLASEMKDAVRSATPLDPARYGPVEGQEKTLELESKLKQALGDLASDEQIFADKRRENEDLLARLQDMESERDRCSNELERALDNIRRLEGALVEQQTKITEQQSQLGHGTGGGGAFELPLSAGRRAMSVPPHAMRTKSASGSNTARDRRPEARRLHTSPPLFSLERIVQGFRARSQLLIRHLEDNDAVLQESLTDSSGPEDSDTETKALGQTWSKEERGGSSSARQRRRTQIKNNKVANGTLTKSRAGQDTPSEAVDLRSSVEAGHERVRASQRNMQESHHKLRDLNLNIKLKEELIRELAKTSKESEAANKKYSNKIKLLEKDAQKARQELMEAKRHLHGLGSKGEMESKEKNKLEDEYQKKMEKAHSKVKELMKKQQESERVLKMQTQREKKIEDLEIAVGRMKQHQELQQARLREEGDRKLKLERDLQRDQQRIKELEIKNDQQQKILKRKTEEVAAAQRKLRVGSAHAPDHDKVEEQRKWLDTEVEKILQRKKKMKDLEEELKKREVNLAKKESMLREMGELEMRKLRSSQSISRDMTGLASKLESVEREIEEKNNTLRVSLDAQKPVIGREVQALREERERLLHQRIHLDEKLQQGTLLSATEERRLIELDEGVEALEAAIEYKNDVISTKKKDLRRNDLTQSEAMLMSRLNSLAPLETKSLLAKYFEKVIDLREGDRRKELEISELEVKLDEQERVIRTLEGSLRSAGMESEHRLVEQQKDYERKVQMLMRELQGEGGGGDGGSALEHKLKELEKDLFYYKKTSRDLKKKLREFVQASTSSSNGHEEVRGHGSAHGLPAQGGDAVPREATPVRKSRREVRELSDAEVSLRKSSASQRSSIVADSIESVTSRGNNPWN
ncbi:kinesin-like protein KIF27 [Strongylocentrotus purpuratus]|uniref:Kinesin motor domain-containing protein n=1 Tax=Strongylocentrotus purpuratus TaxID=7668 RepID=A0A7M7PAJ5_STRPU|nr:kinesin-like protein KIF27 [Strongylocentrotus purpuratus]